MNAVSYWYDRLFGDWYSSRFPERFSLLQLREILLQQHVLDQICLNLTTEEKIALRSVLRIPTLRCPFSFSDRKSQRIITLPEVNDNNLKLYSSIQWYGFAGYFEQIMKEPSSPSKIKLLITLIKLGLDMKEVTVNVPLEDFKIRRPFYPAKKLISYAVKERSPELLEAILEADEDIKEGKYRDQTALMYNVYISCFRSDSATLPIAQLLIKYGSNPNAETIRHLSPNQLFDELRFAGARVTNQQITDAFSESGYLLDLVASYRVGTDRNPNPMTVETYETRTVLMNAVLCHNIDMVKLLIAAGANLNTREALTGATALSYVRENNVEMIKVLLNAGADPNIPNYFGRYPRVSEIRA